MQKFVITWLVGILSVSATAVYAETPVYQPKYQTIAHEILKIESEVVGTTPNYEVLDRIIDEVKQRITVQASYSQDEAKTVLQQIATALYEKNFLEGETMLLTETCISQGMNDQEVFIADCDTFSFIYLGIGEALGLPLRMVSLPQHTFMRWHFPDGTYLNWETTAPVSWTDSAYILWYNTRHNATIPPNQELKSLHRSEVLAIVYYNLGNTLTKEGQYDQAIEQYTRALVMNPLHANAFYQRGNAWYLKGNNDQAIADFSSALDLNPSDVDALYLRANVWYTKGEYDNAIADYSNALVVNPYDAEAIYLRGSAWYKKGSYDKALADFSRALEMDPEFVEVYNDMAWLFATCPDERYRDGQKAIRLIQKALKLQPEARKYYLDTLAAAYAEIGNFQEAIATQQKAIAFIQIELRGENLEVLSKYLQRLELYKAHKPYRE